MNQEDSDSPFRRPESEKGWKDEGGNDAISENGRSVTDRDFQYEMFSGRASLIEH